MGDQPIAHRSEYSEDACPHSRVQGQVPCLEVPGENLQKVIAMAIIKETSRANAEAVRARDPVTEETAKRRWKEEIQKIVQEEREVRRQ